jgi:hypothetical protein
MSTSACTADLLLLLKYLSGRLPVSDFELDFGKKGTALNMLNSLFEFIGKSINGMSRPVDAIKHQAKTVTVGTSRISEKTEGFFSTHSPTMPSSVRPVAQPQCHGDEKPAARGSPHQWLHPVSYRKS